jgi:hypothetical protein
MRSHLTLLVSIGYFIPKPALGAVVPVFFYRPPPTKSPTSLPSHQPSSRPSSQPTSNPSLKPSSRPSSWPSSWPSSRPSSRPSSHPTINITYSQSSQPSLFVHPTSQPSSNPSSPSYLRTTHSLAVTSDRKLIPPLGIGLIIALIVILLFVGHRIQLNSKSRRQPGGVGGGEGDKISEDNPDGTTAAETNDDSADPKLTDAEHASQAVTATVWQGVIMAYFQTRIERAIDSLTTQKKRVHFANKKKVQVFHIEEEPSMVSFDCIANHQNSEADRATWL